LSGWVDVASTDQLTPGGHKVVDVDGVEVAVFNIGGEFLAIEDICTHDGGDLACGDVEGDVIVCPRHGAKFSLRTGEVLAPPAYEPVAALPVRVENNMVQVKDDRWD
jgi:3-phenylpropionate/trans-cinnamate dioxygenase ferredoxin subunit